jgi:hypothetical protein
MRMKRLVLTTVLPVSTIVLGATPEAQQLPKSGKFTGWYAVINYTDKNGNPSAIFTRNSTT